MKTELKTLWDQATNSFGASQEIIDPLSMLFLRMLGDNEPLNQQYVALDAFADADQPKTSTIQQQRIADIASLTYHLAQKFTLPSAIGMNTTLSRLAFLSPEATETVFDVMSTAWMAAKAGEDLSEQSWPNDEKLVAAEAALAQSKKLPEEVSRRTWTMIDNAADYAGKPGELTAEIAQIAGLLSEKTFATIENTVGARGDIAPLVSSALSGAMPKDIDLNEIKDSPENSLGDTFYRLITDNNFDVEVLSAGDERIEDAPLPALFYTNKRILQTHDVYHLVANYPITPLGEIGISGFQLAQLGQHYSAAFFAVASRMTLFTLPMAFDPFLQLTFEGWRHGRRSPNLLGVNWHDMWDKKITEIRNEIAIEPFSSSIPDLSPDLRPEIH